MNPRVRQQHIQAVHGIIFSGVSLGNLPKISKDEMKVFENQRPRTTRPEKDCCKKIAILAKKLVTPARNVPSYPVTGTIMISFWHLTAVCCVPHLNPDRRLREKAIFHDVAQDTARRPAKNSPRVRGRWELRALELAGK